MTESLWFRVLLVAGAGAIGSVARWGVSHATQALTGTKYPSGTLVVNVLGCFLFGVVVELLRHRIGDDHLRLLILTGFCGAFTTFSTFAYDTYRLQTDHGLAWSAANVVLHLALGLGGLLLGIAVAARSA
jgi:CrcB protein